MIAPQKKGRVYVYATCLAVGIFLVLALLMDRSSGPEELDEAQETKDIVSDLSLSSIDTKIGETPSQYSLEQDKVWEARQFTPESRALDTRRRAA